MSLFPIWKTHLSSERFSAERNDWVHGTIYVQSKRVYIIDDPHCVWRSFSLVDGDGARTAGVAGQGWVEVGFGTGGCGWMTDGVDSVWEVWDGVCYQLSRRQACLCDVCTVAPYFIALFLSSIYGVPLMQLKWDLTPPFSFALFSFFCHHIRSSFLLNFTLAYSSQHQEN